MLFTFIRVYFSGREGTQPRYCSTRKIGNRENFVVDHQNHILIRKFDVWFQIYTVCGIKSGELSWKYNGWISVFSIFGYFMISAVKGGLPVFSVLISISTELARIKQTAIINSLTAFEDISCTIKNEECPSSKSNLAI